MRLFRRGASASTLDLLVAGLKPGRAVRAARHNLGHMVCARRAPLHGVGRDSHPGDFVELRLDGARVALRRSRLHERVGVVGRRGGALLQVPPERLLVVHDEVDLERAAFKRGRAGAGRLQRARSIAQHLGTAEFMRLRVGVGRPERGDPRPVADWVLTPFPAEVDVDVLVGRAADAVEAIAVLGLDEAQQRFNERL